jgi:hypothetical protein
VLTWEEGVQERPKARRTQQYAKSSEDCEVGGQSIEIETTSLQAVQMRDAAKATRGGSRGYQNETTRGECSWDHRELKYKEGIKRKIKRITSISLVERK